ncbi:RING finger protein 222 isoform X2 [Stegostoma tigrinum]|nr:RING finger protein 222 isoform X2 [Stegostoma tigrinum]XP_048411283.1 RING finger protein 222 isoform X2 [Stegostoma tigrinum]XP_048411284.1 RING finger protein 222 isoform X2 [Stegostoma tigrinum]XP_048411285.1 RING finger protein 222 isoform X2 [Stegostoma tigrinum]
MSEEGSSECPVCYEKVSRQNQSLRTLSCNHVFCHDCLVKTVINQERQPKKVVCPVCRHVTFLSKKSTRWTTAAKDAKQTLEIPLAPTATRDLRPLGAQLGAAPPPPPPPLRSLLRRWAGSCRRTFLAAARHPAAVSTSQVFVISGRGRPMSEEELRAPADGLVLEHRRCRLRWVLVLLCFIIIGAVVAAILPWVISFK